MLSRFQRDSLVLVFSAASTPPIKPSQRWRITLAAGGRHPCLIVIVGLLTLHSKNNLHTILILSYINGTAFAG
jgi:hypothetical protein